MKYRKSSIALASAAIVAVGTQFAGAVPTLYLSDGANWVQVTDTTYSQFGVVTPALPGDLSPPLGSVAFSGSIGSWIVNVTTGVSDPITTAPYPHLDINSINSSKAGAMLTMLWSDTDFGPNPGGSMKMHIGGTLAPGASLTYNVFGDAGNAVLATTTLLGTLGPFGGPGAFSANGGGGNLGALGSSYSITQKIVLTHQSAGGSSFDAETQVPDGGTTLALLGCSMLGLGGLRRKFSNR